MPTQIGTIWAQWVGYTIAQNAVGTYTLHPNNRDITAEAALAILSVGEDQNHYVETGISQIVANGANETFDPPLPRIQRSNVTEITFRTAAGNATIRGRHVIHYWE